MNTRQIKIQNIIALHEGYGEHGWLFTPYKDTVTRLLEYVQSLVHITEQKHKTKLQEETEDELVTRLVLNEFSLYPKEPLTVKEYKRFISGLNKMAAKLPPNIHLVIATFPVIWTDGKHHNVGLHIQSPRKRGDKPIIHHFDKRTPHPIDKTYDSYELYDIAEGDYYKDATHSPYVVLADTPVTHKNQFKGAIRIKTAEGRQFISAIEICFEHLHDLAFVDTINLISALKERGKPVPKRGTHVISSGTIPVEKDRLIASYTHADNDYYRKKKAIEGPAFKTKFGADTKVFIYPPKKVKEFKNIDVDQITAAISPTSAPSRISSTKARFFSWMMTVQRKMMSMFPSYSFTSKIEQAKPNTNLTAKPYDVILPPDFDFEDKFELYGGNVSKQSHSSNPQPYDVILPPDFNFEDKFELYGELDRGADKSGSQVTQSHGLTFFSSRNVAAVKIKQASNDVLTQASEENTNRPSLSCGA